MTDPKRIPNNNIKFSHIYNVLNDASAPGGTNHNGSDPISLNSFRSREVVESELVGALIATEDRKFNYMDGTSGTSINYSDYIITNVGTADGYSSGLPQNLNVWPTPTDMDGNGSNNDDSEDLNNPSNAWISSSDSSYDYMSGNKGFPNSFSFMLLHNSSEEKLIISWRRSSEGNYDTLYMYEYKPETGDDSDSFLRPAPYTKILQNSTSASIDEDTGSITSSAEYIVIFYAKDGSVNFGDDRAYFKIVKVNSDSGLIPKTFTSNTVSSSNIIRDGQSINLDSTTKGQTYYAESGFRFYDNGGPSGNVDENSDGIITFDAGNDNLRFNLTFNSFQFPASNDLVQPGQLSIRDGNDSDSLSRISVPWMIDPSFGKQSPTGTDWDRDGHVLPYSSYIAGLNGETYITRGRYVQFSYTNNVEPSTNFNFNSYPSEGWDILLQVVNLSNEPLFNTISGSTISGTNLPLSIKDDFSGRTKTHDTTIQITNLAGFATTITSTNTNAAVIKLNLLTNNSSSVISSNNSFTTNDITVISTIGNETNQATVSNLITAGANAFRADITPVGTFARQLNVYVKDNKFFAEGKIWNRRSNLAPNSLRLQLNFPKLTISSDDVTNGGSTTKQSISLIITCQHNFDGLLANDIQLVNCEASELNTINGKQKQITVIASSFGDISISIGSGTIFESDTGNRFENPVSSLFSYSYSEGPDPFAVFVHFNGKVESENVKPRSPYNVLYSHSITKTKEKQHIYIGFKSHVTRSTFQNDMCIAAIGLLSGEQQYKYLWNFSQIYNSYVSRSIQIPDSLEWFTDNGKAEHHLFAQSTLGYPVNLIDVDPRSSQIVAPIGPDLIRTDPNSDDYTGNDGKFYWSTGTPSSNTGANGGITIKGFDQETQPPLQTDNVEQLSRAQNGEKILTQVNNTYFVYRETTSSDPYTGCIMRTAAPVTIEAGDKLQIIYHFATSSSGRTELNEAVDEPNPDKLTRSQDMLFYGFKTDESIIFRRST